MTFVALWRAGWLLLIALGIGTVVAAQGIEMSSENAVENKAVTTHVPYLRTEIPRVSTTGQMPVTRPVSLEPPTWHSGNRSGNFLRDFVRDEADLWSSPRKIRFEDASWLVPLSGISAGLFVTDADVNNHLSQKPSTLSHYNSLSNIGVAAMVGGAGAMWVFSHFNGNQHWRETGFLAGEAALHSLAMTEVLKYSFRRERPLVGDGSGSFFQPGGDSFPSAHAAVAWSVAGVIAHEYHGTLTKILAYSGAALVSYSRIRAEKHFSSDVFIGSLLGTLAANQIYTSHHDPELGGDTWMSPANLFYDESHSRPGAIGSPYVPLDSWIYPALDRLAAMGFVNSAYAGMRPWTRLVCANMVIEAQRRGEASNSVAGELISELETEFTPEMGGGADRGLASARLESIYFRTENISGQPLTDGYHFGQTQVNDFGRPYGEGWSTVTGISSYASSGPWVVYVRGEVQTAPSIPAPPLSARQFIANFDALPGIPPSTPTPSVQRFQLLDAYVGLTLGNWESSFGKQSLSWGPGDGGSLMFSDNADPILMFRVNRVTPWRIPLVSYFLGPVRIEFFFGQLTGHHFVGEPNSTAQGSYLDSLDPQPYIHGQRFSFKPTRNFEFGFSRTTIMGGPGIPLTLGTFKHSLLGSSNGLPGSVEDPGDRRSGMDWSYRLPLMRKWVTFYGDAFADDQFTPIAYWDRSAIRGGLFISHLPKLKRLDLRVEGVYTDVPAGGAIGHGFFYFNTRFRNGYTNDSSLIGSWIGRDGQGAQAWANYWFSAKNRIQFTFRHQKVSQQFTPGGGTVTDGGIRGDYWLKSGIGFTASVQYERWLFPVIQPGPENNVTASLQVQFQPQRLFQPFRSPLNFASGGDSN